MKGMVDIFGGRITLKEINDEIAFALLTKQPRKLVVEIKRLNGYHATIWISEEDFDKEVSDDALALFEMWKRQSLK